MQWTRTFHKVNGRKEVKRTETPGKKVAVKIDQVLLTCLYIRGKMECEMFMFMFP